MTRLAAYLTDDAAGEFEPDPDATRATADGSDQALRPAGAHRARSPDGKDLLATLAEIDRDLGVGFARPDHLVHICGRGLICPATEPTETGFPAPWPRAPTAAPMLGKGSR